MWSRTPPSTDRPCRRRRWCRCSMRRCRRGSCRLRRCTPRRRPSRARRRRRHCPGLRRRRDRARGVWVTVDVQAVVQVPSENNSPRIRVRAWFMIASAPQSNTAGATSPWRAQGLWSACVTRRRSLRVPVDAAGRDLEHEARVDRHSGGPAAVGDQASPSRFQTTAACEATRGSGSFRHAASAGSIVAACAA